jgi:large conductance mechanosensitive channel
MMGDCNGRIYRTARIEKLRKLFNSCVLASTFMTVSPTEKRTFIQEFVLFLKTFGVIGLAIAFVIGQAANALVTAFVKDIIDPFIGLFLPAGSLASVTIKVPNLVGSTTEFKIGDLISNIINFLVIALIVFVAYKQLSRYGIVEDKTKGDKTKDEKK